MFDIKKQNGAVVYKSTQNRVDISRGSKFELHVTSLLPQD